MIRLLLIFCILAMGKMAWAQTNTFPSSGNVGIGTNSPSFPLHVDGNIYGTGVIGQTLWTGDGSQGMIRKLSASIPLRFLTNVGTEEMRIDANGNVGIGTSIPNAKLDVNGNFYLSSTNSFVLFGSNASVHPYLQVNTSTNGLGIGNNNTTKLYVADNGDIGLGTMSPGNLLSLYNSGGGQYTQWYSSSTGTSSTDGLRIGLDGSSNAVIDNNEGTSFYIKNNGTTAVTVSSSQYVGIGTTSPSEKLSVNGKIRAKEIKVETSGWSDFVFEDGYKLPDLKEIEAFIKEYKHLPEIPSAKDVEANGINLGEMNAKLLQKIEELTLYLVEKDKQVKDLQERMKKMESKKSRRQKNISL